MLAGEEFLACQTGTGLVEALCHTTLGRAPEEVGAPFGSELPRHGAINATTPALALMESLEFARYHPGGQPPLDLAMLPG